MLIFAPCGQSGSSGSVRGAVLLGVDCVDYLCVGFFFFLDTVLSCQFDYSLRNRRGVVIVANRCAKTKGKCAVIVTVLVSQRAERRQMTVSVGGMK